MKYYIIAVLMFLASVVEAQTFHYDLSTLDKEVHAYAEGRFGSDPVNVDGPLLGTHQITADVSAILNNDPDDNYYSVAKATTNINTSSKTILGRLDLDIIAEAKTPGVTILTEVSGISDVSVDCYMTGQASAVFNFDSTFILDADDKTASGFKVSFYVGPYNSVTATYDAGDDEWDLSGAYTNQSGVLTTVNESIDASTVKVKTYKCEAPANENEQIHLAAGINTGLSGLEWLSKGLDVTHTGVRRTYSTDCSVLIKFTSFD